MLIQDEAADEPESDEIADPRWAILNKLKFDDLNSKN
jgi:hypothetical protein